MNNIENEYAKIERVFFGIEDHGILGLGIDFQRGTNTHQGTGIYNVQNAKGMDFIKHILMTFNVTELSQLVGKVVRVYTNEGRIEAVQQAEWDGDKLVHFKAFWEDGA